MQVLVTRPQPEAARTAARLTALGHDVVLAPLLITAAVDWELPEVLPEAVAFTSAAAVRLAGPQLATLRHLPVFVVGAATAQAARDAGFAVPGQIALASKHADPVNATPGTAAALLERIGGSGLGRVLYLAGRDRAARDLPPNVDLHVVYAATLAAALAAPAVSALAGTSTLTLLYSARTAGHFAALVDAARLDRRRLAIAALSPQVLAAAGPGWASGIAAPVPTETALLAAAGLRR